MPATATDFEILFFCNFFEIFETATTLSARIGPCSNVGRRDLGLDAADTSELFFEVFAFFLFLLGFEIDFLILYLLVSAKGGSSAALRS